MPVASAATSASRTAIRGAAEPAVADIGAHPGGEAGEDQADIIETPRRVEGGWKFRPGDADAAAGDALPGQRDLRDDGGEAERRHREIKRAQPQRRQPDDDAEHRADAARNHQRDEYRHRRHDIAGDQHAGGVGAERQQRDVTDGEMTGEADHQVEAGDQHPVDRGAGADQCPVVVADKRQDQRGRQHAGERRQRRQPCSQTSALAV